MDETSEGDNVDSDASSSSETSKDSDSDSQKTKTKTKISDELAALGIYALSIKRKKDWLKQGNMSYSRACPPSIPDS